MMCEFCGNDGIPLYDVKLDDKTSRLFRCVECRSCQAFPAFSDEAVKAFYEAGYFQATSWEIEKSRQLANDYFQKISRASEPAAICGTALEVGSSYGFFAQKAVTKLGLTVDVVEPSVVCQDFMRKQGWLSPIYSTLDDLPPGRHYDNVFCFHVVEHLPRFGDFAVRIAALLKDTGKLWVLTPNAKSRAFQETNAFWGWSCCEQHFQFLSPDIPQAYLRSVGLVLLRTEDLIPADAHYASYWHSRIRRQLAWVDKRIGVNDHLGSATLKSYRRILEWCAGRVPAWPAGRRVGDLERKWEKVVSRRPHDELLLVLAKAPRVVFPVPAVDLPASRSAVCSKAASGL